MIPPMKKSYLELVTSLGTGMISTIIKVMTLRVKKLEKCQNRMS